MTRTNRFSKWLKSRNVTASFAIIALIGGFLFIGPKFTGNIILSEKYGFNPVSIIGALLILCAIILGVYSIKNKN